MAKICSKTNLGLEIQKTNVGIRISILQTLRVPIFRQNDNFDFFRTKNLSKNCFWCWNFKTLSLDSESAPPRYQVCQCSVKMDNFELYGLNLGKFPNYMQYFGSNTVEGVAESQVEVDGAKWRLKWTSRGEWSWVELGGGGYTVYNTHFILAHFSAMFHFYSPLKLQKTKDILRLPGGREMEKYSRLD